MINEFVPPGHFYSVIPSINRTYNDNGAKFIDLSFNDTRHLEILDDIGAYLTDFDNSFGVTNIADLNGEIKKRQGKFIYSLMNGAFEWMDARMLHYFLQKNKPKRIIEIGSGNSTLMTYNTKKMFNLDVKIVCVEPYPSAYLKGLAAAGGVTLIAERLETVGLELFDSLGENDILFIDSSHVLKLDSDVMYYFTQIFPRLRKGVLIHIHDIFFPHDYPLSWLKEGRFWNEQYFLYVFLQYNTKFRIEFCNSYAKFKFNDKLTDLLQNSYEIVNKFCNDAFGGGSIWLTVGE